MYFLTILLCIRLGFIIIQYYCTYYINLLIFLYGKWPRNILNFINSCFLFNMSSRTTEIRSDSFHRYLLHFSWYFSHYCLRSCSTNNGARALKDHLMLIFFCFCFYFYKLYFLLLHLNLPTFLPCSRLLFVLF